MFKKKQNTDSLMDTTINFVGQKHATKNTDKDKVNSYGKPLRKKR